MSTLPFEEIVEGHLQIISQNIENDQKFNYPYTHHLFRAKLDDDSYKKIMSELIVRLRDKGYKVSDWRRINGYNDWPEFHGAADYMCIILLKPESLDLAKEAGWRF
ncbi:hypothetical protein [Dyadobacter diqingensis]|uniref:hypothetical protein n=1 Tax=Dyadobacter diqingensis TaxID=2938121 RepID=UPI0020C1B1C8|nr:hypothetical protein [Dyadobacter diqingensis]